MSGDEMYAIWLSQGAGHYIVVRGEKVVQEIVAENAGSAEKQQAEEGLLYVQVGGQVNG